MYKNIVLLIAFFATSLNANENYEEIESRKSDTYIVIKGLTTFGDNISEIKNSENITLNGDTGIGFGIDLGYRMKYGFNIEFDFSYSRSDIKEIIEETGDITNAKADYYTYALDIVYDKNIYKEWSCFVKGGYEYEVEDISKLDEHTHDSGFVYGVGLEYELEDGIALLTEYENSFIDGPRGAGLFVGVVLDF